MVAEYLHFLRPCGILKMADESHLKTQSIPNVIVTDFASLGRFFINRRKRWRVNTNQNTQKGCSALEKLKQLLPTRVPDDSVEIISDVSKVQDNCFIVSGKEPAFPKQITLLGASF
jgi:hypothetical protein